MTIHEEKKIKVDREEANIGGVLESMVGLVQAGAQFSVEQIQNAAGLITDPKAAMGRMKNSIDHVSDALSGKGEDLKVVEQDAAGNRTEVHLNGRKA
jgi:hypothetical protein